MRVYISGPITGTTDYKKRFRKAERYLKKQGHEVINPVRLSALLPKTCNHNDYMNVDLAALKACHAIYLLEGWKNSKGSRMECRQARANGIKILED